MRILNVTCFYSGITRGGTESYVDGLNYELNRYPEVDSRILVITDKTDVRISSPLVTCISLRQETTAKESEGLIHNALRNASPEIILIHTDFNLEEIVAMWARNNHIPYFFFVHSAGWLCEHFFRDSNGRDCISVMSFWHCVCCMRRKSGKSTFLGYLSAVCGELLRFMRLSKKSWLHSVYSFQSNFRSLVSNAARVVVFTRNDYNRFFNSGISGNRLLLVPQGLSEETLDRCKFNKSKEREGRLTFGYVGRAIKEKGVHLLVEAALTVPKDKQFELRVYGMSSDEYCQELRSKAKEDERICFYDIMSSSEILNAYGQIDVLCIPSLVYETGPLTLLEGLYSGCVVAGSSHLGQIDYLKQNGTVVPNDDAESWASFFNECLVSATKIRNNRNANTVPIRSMRKCAEVFISACKAFAQ